MVYTIPPMVSVLVMSRTPPPREFPTSPLTATLCIGQFTSRADTLNRKDILR